MISRALAFRALRWVLLGVLASACTEEERSGADAGLDAVAAAPATDGQASTGDALVEASQDSGPAGASDAIKGSTGCELTECGASASRGFEFVYSCGTPSAQQTIMNVFDDLGRHVGQILDVTFTNGRSVHCELRAAPNTPSVRFCRDDTGAMCSWGPPS
jgi:hypothetical protein